jgi:hypothetical protein
MRANTSAIDFGACDELLDSSSDALMVKVRAELQPGSTRRVQFPQDYNPSPTGHRGHARFRLPRSNRHGGTFSTKPPAKARSGHYAKRRLRSTAGGRNKAGRTREVAFGGDPISVSRADVREAVFDSTTPTQTDERVRKPPGKKFGKKSKL